MIESIINQFDFGSKSRLSEGLFYDQLTNQLLWVDILGHKIFRYNFNTLSLQESFSYGLPSSITPIKNSKPDDYLVTFEHQITIWNAKSNKIVDVLVDLDQDQVNQYKDIRFNDGKCDPNGLFYVGTMDINNRPQRANLYLLDEQKKLQTCQTTSLSNGMGWSLDGSTMYFIDTPEKSIQVSKYDTLNKIKGATNNSIDLSSYEGVPDGMTVDAEGKIWVAMWEGSQILRVDPEVGKVIEQINLPMSKPTTCVFGGSKLDTIYIASATVEGEDHSGYLNVHHPKSNVKGRAGICYNYL